MERLYYRSTSLTDLQAELRQRELLAAATPKRPASLAPPRVRGFLGLPLFRRRRS